MDCKRKQCNCSGLNCMQINEVICFLGWKDSHHLQRTQRDVYLNSDLGNNLTWFNYEDFFLTMICNLSDLDARLAMTDKLNYNN